MSIGGALIVAQPPRKRRTKEKIEVFKNVCILHLL
jgi:hypothetical protein